MTHHDIANLIAQIDTGAANVYRNQPFNRETIIRAFMKGCQGTKFEDVSFRIWAIHSELAQATKETFFAEVA